MPCLPRRAARLPHVPVLRHVEGQALPGAGGDEVKDKTHANFCDYFSPTPAAWQPEQLSAADQARAQLEALFGRK